MKNKTEVILLPTKVTAPSFTEGFIVKCTKKPPKSIFTPPNLNELFISINSNKGVLDYFEPQHLYFLSDEQPEEGDWYFDSMYRLVLKATKTSTHNGGNNYKKIIATTDTNLGLVVDHHGIKMPAYSRTLPQPTKQFIEYYVTESNKGNVIKFVHVEYTSKYLGKEKIGTTPSGEPTYISNREIYLKVNPDNTINIIPFKDSWSRTEVIEFAEKCINRGIQLKTDLKVIHKKDHIDKWIEENL